MKTTWSDASLRRGKKKFMRVRIMQEKAFLEHYNSFEFYELKLDDESGIFNRENCCNASPHIHLQ